MCSLGVRVWRLFNTRLLAAEALAADACDQAPVGCQMPNRRLQIARDSATAAAKIEQTRQVQMCLPEVPIERDGFPIRLDGRIPEILIFEHNSEIEPVQGRRSNHQRRAIVPLCCRQVPVLVQQAPKVVVGVGKAWAACECSSIGRDGRHRVTDLQRQSARKPDGSAGCSQASAPPLQTKTEQIPHGETLPGGSDGLDHRPRIRSVDR
jgi:hypothetical protein